MSENLIFGRWLGEFVYGADYGDLEGEKVSFVMFIEKIDDSGFQGKAFDIGGVGANAEVATVRGYFEKGSIDFIKNYPTTKVINEDGTLETYSRKSSPDIHYIGELYANLKTFKGDWEIEWSEVNELGEYTDYLNTGTWEMRKDKD